jgi:hypothetical protein
LYTLQSASNIKLDWDLTLKKKKKEDPSIMESGSAHISFLRCHIPQNKTSQISIIYLWILEKNLDYGTNHIAALHDSSPFR